MGLWTRVRLPPNPLVDNIHNQGEPGTYPALLLKNQEIFKRNIHDRKR